MVVSRDSDAPQGIFAVAGSVRPDDPASDGAAASYYRIYLMDRESHIRSHRVIRCAQDEDAVADAMQALGEYPCVEVWNGERLVRRLILRGYRTPDATA
jgi:hypothetical protein